MNNELNEKELNENELDEVAGGAKDRIQCPHCKQMISVNLEKSNVKCPKCGKKI